MGENNGGWARERTGRDLVLFGGREGKRDLNGEVFLTEWKEGGCFRERASKFWKISKRFARP